MPYTRVHSIDAEAAKVTIERAKALPSGAFEPDRNGGLPSALACAGTDGTKNWFFSGTNCYGRRAWSQRAGATAPIYRKP
jgi:hypothetical protein